MSTYPLILVAEDDYDERHIFLEAFKEIGAPAEVVHFFDDGESLLSFLDENAGETYPSLIVLDINMPKLGGKRTLEILKAHPSYKHIPVMIYSTMYGQTDLMEYSKMGALSFDRKPDDYYESVEVAKKFFNFASQKAK